MKSELGEREEVKGDSFDPAPLLSCPSSPSSSSGTIDQTITFSSRMKYLSPGLLKEIDNILRPRNAMDIFAYTLPDRIRRVFSALHDEAGKLIRRFKEFYDSISRRYCNDKQMAEQLQYQRDASTELLTCINEMMDYISSMTLTVDSEGFHVLTPLTDSLTAFIDRYDSSTR